MTSRSSGTCTTQNPFGRKRYRIFTGVLIYKHHLNSARQSDLVIVNKIKLRDRKKRDKYFHLAREIKKNIQIYIIYLYFNWWTWNNPQMIGKSTGRLGNKRTSEEYPD